MLLVSGVSTELECVTQEACGNSDYTTNLTALIIIESVDSNVGIAQTHNI